MDIFYRSRLYKKNVSSEVSPKKLSVVIPIRNEERNILVLIEQIHRVFTLHNIVYEVIFVDDCSTDRTREVIRYIAKHYPVFLHIKKGEMGKPQSLLEGFSYAKYDFICTLDASLQYPIEVIPEMLKTITDRGADIVVANRYQKYAGKTGKIFDSVFKFIFTQLLHNLNCDIRSSLKIFKKEILRRISVDPDPWTFDLEFLLHSRDADYKISGRDILFQEIKSQETKVKILKESIKLGLAALKESFEDSEVVPFPEDQTKKEGQGFHYNGKKYIHYTKLNETESAFYRITKEQAVVILALLVILFVQLMSHWYTTTIFVILLTSLLYFCDLLFNFFLIIQSFSKSSHIVISQEELVSLRQNEWPTYTILCPLYKEWQVLPQFVTAMHRLEYPVDKLQVLLLLEENDQETIARAFSYNLPQSFQIVIVPNSLPKTKPKALNYGLFYATGEYVVVYDAEDVPDPLQLKKAIISFQKADNKTICIQAKLNFYNTNQNILTKLFTSEYSLWFDLTLPGLQSIGAPIPLGGTSNHFKTDILRKINGWDAFNVTEDCDLGMRLVKRGYKTAMMNSTTLEEANSNVINWFFQRTRWIKGYIQTYFVHMRNPDAFFRDWKHPHLLTFQLIVGGKILSMFINPFFWIITLSYFVFRAHIGVTIESFFPPFVLYLCVFSFVFGNFLYLYYYMIGAARKKQYELIKYAFLVPFYWLGMSFAAWVATYNMFISPYYWAKTIHGFHLKNKNTIIQAARVIGKDLVDKRMRYYPFKI